MIDILVCTHNPRPAILTAVISSIASQKSSPDDLQILIVDNGSNPPLEVSILAPLTKAGIPARLITEAKLGLSNARHRAIAETDGDWILFVDDDNELRPDFIQNGIAFIKEHPEVGCVGGRLLLPDDATVDSWVKPFLPYLGIRDLGDVPKIAKSETWTDAEPPGAGAWVRRDVAALYAKRLEDRPKLVALGRTGSDGFFSSDDSCMTRGAYSLGLAVAYCPTLTLTHHIAPSRFTFPYLLQLMSAYGPSNLLLEQGLRGEHPLEAVYEDDSSFAQLLDSIFQNGALNGRMKVAQMLWQISARNHHQKALSCNSNMPAFTVVTPCLNAVATIERTILSIIEQNYPNLQYIVCDGGSTDGTLEVLRRYSHVIDVLISGKDKNVPDALNKGFRRASGELLCYLNADDCFAPNALRKVATIFRNDPTIDVVTGSCHRWYEDGSDVITKVPENYLDVVVLRNPIEQPSTFWRATIQKTAGPFNDEFPLSFDWEYWNRLKVLGAKFHRTDKLLSFYYFTADNLTSRGGQRVVDEMYRITAKYAGAAIGDAYLNIFNNVDMNGLYDVPFEDLPTDAQRQMQTRLNQLRAEHGDHVIDNYNWNWASKQIRGKKWY